MSHSVGQAAPVHQCMSQSVVRQPQYISVCHRVLLGSPSTPMYVTQCWSDSPSTSVYATAHSPSTSVYVTQYYYGWHQWGPLLVEWLRGKIVTRWPKAPNLAHVQYSSIQFFERGLPYLLPSTFYLLEVKVKARSKVKL